MLKLVPIKQADAFAFVRQHHRHSKVPVGSCWQHSVHDADGNLCGVAICGRPVARPLQDGFTVEVTRCCTNEARNACSMLYAAARRAAIAQGYRRGITYIRADEPGTSLKAAGWRFLWKVTARNWDTPSRRRDPNHHEEIEREAWGWGDWSGAAS
jgi:hypothetical protein